MELLMFKHERCGGNIYKVDKDVQRPGKYSKSIGAIVYITRFVIFNGGNSFFFLHDDVNKWKHFPPYWPFVRGIHRSKVSDAELLMFSLIRVWINGWVNNREADDLRRYRAHYDVIVMTSPGLCIQNYRKSLYNNENIPAVTVTQISLP